MVGMGCEFYIEKKTDWLTTLLESDFFSPCSDHQNLRKNEKNVLCIPCGIGFCRHCKAHLHHPSLQICKYVYQDVVRSHEIQKLLDCSRIQTYKINGEKAVHLNPRPQAKDARPSTKPKTGAACEVCRRYLQDQPNRFCSIACKVSAVGLKPKNQNDQLEFPVQEFPDHLSWLGNQNSISSETESSLKPRKGRNKRKGIPHRSPLS